MLIKVKKGNAFMANRRHFTDKDNPVDSSFFGENGEEEAQRLVDGGWCDDVTPKAEPVKAEKKARVKAEKKAAKEVK
jgi:hypothetical protein